MPVSNVSSVSKGVSVFAIDPGGTCGWSWCCLGFSELRKVGVLGALEAARRHRSGLLLGDTRFLVGQESCLVPDEPRSEHSLAELMWCTLIMCGEMGGRVSDGAVPCVTDLVLEDFILRNRTRDRSLLSPVRLNSKFEDYAITEAPDMKVWHQSASDAKGTITDERLKRWNLWTPGKQHGRDATRHLLLWLRRHQTLWQ